MALQYGRNPRATGVYRRRWHPAPTRARLFISIGQQSAVLTGTAVPDATEAEIVTGGQTTIITLTNDQWVAAGATFNAERQAIINGCDSNQSELLGWDNVVKALQGVAGVVRDSNTQVTITWDAQVTYSTTLTETITVTVPASAVIRGSSIIATPTFEVTTSGAAVTRRNNLTLVGVS